MTLKAVVTMYKGQQANCEQLLAGSTQENGDIDATATKNLTLPTTSMNSEVDSSGESPEKCSA